MRKIQAFIAAVMLALTLGVTSPTPAAALGGCSTHISQGVTGYAYCTTTSGTSSQVRVIVDCWTKPNYGLPLTVISGPWKQGTYNSSFAFCSNVGGYAIAGITYQLRTV